MFGLTRLDDTEAACAIPKVRQQVGCHRSAVEGDQVEGYDSGSS